MKSSIEMPQVPKVNFGLDILPWPCSYEQLPFQRGSSGKRKRTSFDLFAILMRKLNMIYRLLSTKFIHPQNLKKTTFFQEKKT